MYTNVLDECITVTTFAKCVYNTLNHSQRPSYQHAACLSSLWNNNHVGHLTGETRGRRKLCFVPNCSMDNVPMLNSDAFTRISSLVHVHVFSMQTSFCQWSFTSVSFVRNGSHPSPIQFADRRCHLFRGPTHF